MALHIDAVHGLQHQSGSSLALTCPHCGVFAHLTPSAAPSFAELAARRPRQVGLVFCCDACGAPVFLRFGVRSQSSDRVDLSPQFEEVERPKETFSFAHLPPEVDALFSETLQCYSHGIFNAFASMCRRTLQATFAHLGEPGKLRVFDELNNVRDLAEIDINHFTTVKRVLFGTDSDPAPSLPLIDEEQAGLLVEVVKDLLYQTYVRKARLQQALLLRRGWSEPSSDRIAAHTETSDLGG